MLLIIKSKGIIFTKDSNFILKYIIKFIVESFKAYGESFTLIIHLFTNLQLKNLIQNYNFLPKFIMGLFITIVLNNYKMVINSSDESNYFIN